MEGAAEKTAFVLQEKVGEEDLVVVSYYDEDGVGHVYRSEWAEEKYTPEQVDEIVEDMRLEALGYVTHERRQQEALHATIRVYDELLDVAIPTNETRGVAFALDVDGDYSLREVIATVEDAIEPQGVKHGP